MNIASVHNSAHWQVSIKAQLFNKPLECLCFLSARSSVVERYSYKVDVAGPIPAVPTKDGNCPQLICFSWQHKAAFADPALTWHVNKKTPQQ